MARTDRDSWDLASSVGATATMVAASRAMARPTRPADQRPVRRAPGRAVGLDFFTKVVDGDIESTGDDPLFEPSNRCATGSRSAPGSSTTSSPTPGRPGSAGRHPGRRPGHPRLPAGVAGRHGVFEIDQPEVIEFKTGCSPTWARSPPRTAATVAAGPARRLAVGAADGRFRPGGSRPPGSPRACWSICRPRRRTGCSTRSPRSARRVAGLATEHMGRQGGSTGDWAKELSARAARAVRPATSTSTSCSTAVHAPRRAII